MTEMAYSNAQIESLINGLINKKSKAGLTQNSVSQAIKEFVPEISKEALELFKKQVEYVKYL